MRCTISWVALALLSVSAITGCTGTVWDPMVMKALQINTNPNPLPPGVYYYDAAMAPTPPSAFANSPSSRYGSGSIASAPSSGMTDGNDSSRKQ
jgi:hypothetical protein